MLVPAEQARVLLLELLLLQAPPKRLQALRVHNYRVQFLLGGHFSTGLPQKRLLVQGLDAVVQELCKPSVCEVRNHACAAFPADSKVLGARRISPIRRPVLKVAREVSVARLEAD